MLAERRLESFVLPASVPVTAPELQNVPVTIVLSINVLDMYVCDEALKRDFGFLRRIQFLSAPQHKTLSNPDTMSRKLRLKRSLMA